MGIKFLNSPLPKTFQVSYIRSCQKVMRQEIWKHGLELLALNPVPVAAKLSISQGLEEQQHSEVTW